MIGLCHVCWSSGLEIITKNGTSICLNCNNIQEKEKILCEKCGRDVNNE